MVLRSVAPPMETLKGSSHGKRGIVPEATLVERLQAARGEDFNQMQIYSQQGRLQVIASVFQDREKQKSKSQKAGAQNAFQDFSVDQAEVEKSARSSSKG